MAQNTKSIITLQAKPEAISIEIERTALIVVDMQNDFGSKGGIFDRIGIDISAIQRTVGPIARVVASARQSGIPVIYLKMGFRPDLSDASPPAAPNRIKHRQHIGEAIHAPDGTESRIVIRDWWMRCSTTIPVFRSPIAPPSRSGASCPERTTKLPFC